MGRFTLGRRAHPAAHICSGVTTPAPALPIIRIIFIDVIITAASLSHLMHQTVVTQRHIILTANTPAAMNKIIRLTFNASGHVWA
jgi:hypothetical protein